MWLRKKEKERKKMIHLPRCQALVLGLFNGSRMSLKRRNNDSDRDLHECNAARRELEEENAKLKENIRELMDEVARLNVVVVADREKGLKLIKELHEQLVKKKKPDDPPAP